MGSSLTITQNRTSKQMLTINAYNKCYNKCLQHLQQMLTTNVTINAFNKCFQQMLTTNAFNKCLQQMLLLCRIDFVVLHAIHPHVHLSPTLALVRKIIGVVAPDITSTKQKIRIIAYDTTLKKTLLQLNQMSAMLKQNV